MERLLSAALIAGCAAGAIALASVIGSRRSARRAVGETIHAVRASRARKAARAASAIVALALSASWPAPMGAIGALLALVSLALAVLSPEELERVCGTDGVRSGWESARYEDLVEWRLTGDHLRFRARGEWTAVDLPRASQELVRERLEARCAAAESRFRS